MHPYDLRALGDGGQGEGEYAHSTCVPPHTKCTRILVRRFHIVGGECNYLLQCSAWPECALRFVPEAEWKSAFMLSWPEEVIQDLLSDAISVLLETAYRLRLPVKVGACS